MNKKLLPLAVAATIAAPAVGLADAVIYGKAHMSLDWFDIDGRHGYEGFALNRGKIGKGNSRENRLGIKGSEDIGDGLKAIYQVEFGIPLSNEEDYHIANGDQGSLKMRNSYIGLKGDFGTVLAGRHDTPLKISTVKLELFNDTMADYAGTIGFDDRRADSTIAYISPSFKGLQFAFATIPGSASTAEGTRNRDSKNITDSYSVATTYQNGPWYASVAYEVMSDQLSRNRANINGAKEDYDNGIIDADELADIVAANDHTADNEKWRLGLGIRDLHGFYLSAIYENQKAMDFIEKDSNGKANDADMWQGQIGYAFGNNMIKGMYGQRSCDSALGSDRESWAFGFDHSFNKRTKVYALYTGVDMDSDVAQDWKGLSFGMIHDF